MARNPNISQKLPPRGRVGVDDVSAIHEPLVAKGRGAITNPVGRFETLRSEAFDDGWDKEETASRQLQTQLNKETARTLITFNNSPDIHFDRSINPYRGCEHGCVYCFARPSHAYMGLSSGLDFESQLFYKPNGPDLLRRELAKPRYRPRPIALGVNTDAYQPIERQLRLTRALLEILAEHNHPVTLLTKSALIARDIDLIAPMAAKGLCRVGVSITTLDRKLARRLEPRAAAPHRRLETITALSQADIPVVVMMAPIIPALNDPEIETLLAAACEAGARWAGYVILRLPYEIKDLFHEWLAEHYPDRAARIINHLRDMRGGKDYDAKWTARGRGDSPYAHLIASRFAKTLKRLGMTLERPPLRTDLFCLPSGPGEQIDLFGLN